jgi:acetyltransferase-like isoleucine patch superfamily enzyme
MDNIFVHPTSIVETRHVGEGTRIWAFTHIMESASVGSHCNIGEHCFVESRVKIGNNVTIKNGNMLWEGVTIEEGAFIGPNVFFTNDRYPRSPRLAQAKKRYGSSAWLVPTLVQHGASLGGGVVVIAGVTIGEFALVGAGAVVTHDVPPYALVIGNPARLRGWVCQCGTPLAFRGSSAACEECGQQFTRSGDLVQPSDQASLRRTPAFASAAPRSTV